MEKLSIEEINQLKEFAISERKKHQEIIQQISLHESRWKNKGFCNMPEELQLEILERNRNDEIKPLLESYALYHSTGDRYNQDTIRELSSKFQLKLYETRNTKQDLVRYMLAHCVLCPELEKIVIDTRSPYLLDKKSVSGENYLLTSILVKAIKESDVPSFDIIRSYYQQQRFHSSVEILFVNIITSIRSGRDSVIDGAEKLLKDYINRYGNFEEDAENALIQNGCHELIMFYLENSKRGLSYDSSEEFLFKRAYKEEIELYFKRYSML